MRIEGRARPIDRACPCYRRSMWNDYCIRQLGNGHRQRLMELVFGCPFGCTNRERALEIPGERERYEERRAALLNAGLQTCID